MEPFPPFTYTNRLEFDHVRLLLIAPGEFGSSIAGRLLDENLDSIQAYHTLSYCWGDGTRSHDMCLDDKRFSITESVYEALQHLRSSQDTLRIWIDQVCINQDDIDERSAQVQQMGNVYEHAACTFIWLGPAEPGMEEALQVMHEFGEDYRDDDWRAQHYNHVKKILCNPWFHRVWVLQEAVLAQQCVFVHGHVRRDAHDLSKFVLAFYGWSSTVDMSFIDPEYSTRGGGRDGLISFQDCFGTYRRDLNNRNTLRALSLLGTCRKKQCSNVLDRVYGLQGLLAKSTIATCLPEVDYAKPMIDVFVEITKLGLLCDNSWIGLLQMHMESAQPKTGAAAPDQPGKTGLDGLPSWIPDWSSNPSTSFTQPWLYSAGGNVSCPPNEQNFVDGAKRLLLSGIVVAALETASTPQSDDLWTWGDFIGLYHHISSASKDRYPGKEISSAFGRTLIIDRFWPPQSHSPKRWPSGDAYFDGNPWENFDQDTNFNNAVGSSTMGRAFIVSKGGHIGLGPMGCLPNDLVVVFKGLNMPVVIRKRAVGVYHQMIGPAYVHGIMDGEIWEAAEKGGYKVKEFEVD